jgi:hypothetical protein
MFYSGRAGYPEQLGQRINDLLLRDLASFHPFEEVGFSLKAGFDENTLGGSTDR